MSHPARKPIIAITLDTEEPGGYSCMPWFASRKNYSEAVIKAGGIPFLVPHHEGLAADYAHLADAFVFTGGNFDIDPTLYGITHPHETVITKIHRTNFEMALFKAAYALGKPVLGICGGMQLINVALGGSLIQHIPAEVETTLQHEQPNPRTEAGHRVRIQQNTLLHRLVGSEEIPVNSAHHQAAKVIAPNFIVNAHATDGLVEGIEGTEHPFCLGVQWHPEYHISEADHNIFVGLIRASIR